jgi:hypothetical protein
MLTSALNLFSNNSIISKLQTEYAMCKAVLPFSSIGLLTVSFLIPIRAFIILLLCSFIARSKACLSS